MSMFRTLVLAAVAALGFATAAPVAAQDAQQALSADSVIETIKQRGTLRVGLSTFVPWAMRDKNGALIGFEVDVATRLAADMGVAIEFVPTAWDGIIPALLSGSFDVIIGGMSITPQRNLTVNFTAPYAQSSVGVMAHVASTKALAWPEGYDAPEVTFACRRGGTPCDYIKTHFPKATLRVFDDESQVVQEVLNGTAQAMLASQPLPAFTIYENPEVVFAPTDTLIDPSSEAFALRKGDIDALNFFSNWILARSNDGWLAERHAYWFTGRPWADLVAPE